MSSSTSKEGGSSSPSESTDVVVEVVRPREASSHILSSQIRAKRWDAIFQRFYVVFHREGLGGLEKKPNRELKTWMERQKSRWNKGWLEDAHLAKLLGLGLVEIWEKEWMLRFTEVTRFKEKHGHLIITDNDSLDDWVQQQKVLLHSGTLAFDKQARIQAVLDVGTRKSPGTDNGKRKSERGKPSKEKVEMVGKQKQPNVDLRPTKKRKTSRILMEESELNCMKQRRQTNAEEPHAFSAVAVKDSLSEISAKECRLVIAKREIIGHAHEKAVPSSLNKKSHNPSTIAAKACIVEPTSNDDGASMSKILKKTSETRKPDSNKSPFSSKETLPCPLMKAKAQPVLRKSFDDQDVFSLPSTKYSSGVGHKVELSNVIDRRDKPLPPLEKSTSPNEVERSSSPEAGSDETKGRNAVKGSFLSAKVNGTPTLVNPSPVAQVSPIAMKIEAVIKTNPKNLGEETPPPSKGVNSISANVILSEAEDGTDTTKEDSSVSSKDGIDITSRDDESKDILDKIPEPWIDLPNSTHNVGNAIQVCGFGVCFVIAFVLVVAFAISIGVGLTMGYLVLMGKVDIPEVWKLIEN